MNEPQNPILRQLADIDQRLRQSEVAEVPGVPGAPGGFPSFYAAGTWAPTIVGSGTAGTFVYAATTAGNYERIGRTVLFSGRITITTVSVAPTGNLTIRGLPIAAAAVTSGSPGGAQFSFWSTVRLDTTVANTTYLAGWIQNSASLIDLLLSRKDGGAAALLTGAIASLASGSDMAFQGQYQV